MNDLDTTCVASLKNNKFQAKGICGDCTFSIDPLSANGYYSDHGIFKTFTVLNPWVETEELRDPSTGSGHLSNYRQI